MNGRQYIEHLKSLYCSDEFFNQPIDIYSDHINGITRVLFESGGDILNNKEKRMISESRVPVDADSIQEDIDMRLHGIIDSYPLFRSRIKTVPSVAILPTGSFDAYAQSAPNGDPICILDIKVLNDMALFSRALGQRVEGKSKMDLQKSLFLAVAACFSIRGISSELFDQIQVDSANRLTASTVVLTTLMAQSICAFVLAHELAHHALGHLGHLKTLKMSTYSQLPELDVLTRSQSDELAADREGMNAFLRYWEKHLNLDDKFDWHQVAPLFFFDVMAIIEEISSESAQNVYSNANRSHPPAGMRSDRIYKAFKSQLRPTALDFYSDMIQPFIENVRQNCQKVRPMFE